MLTPTPTTTRVFLACIVAAIICYDLWVLWRVGEEASISRVVYDLARDYPVLAVLFGMMLGHIFWVQRG